MPGHLERLARHAERVAAGGLLEPEPRTECWACGVAAPRSSWLGKIGWETRPADLLPGQCSLDSKYEAYCPDCFAEWGWPDGVGD